VRLVWYKDKTKDKRIFIEFLIFQINKTILYQLSQKPYQKLNYIIKKISTTVMLAGIVIPIVIVAALLQPKRGPE
jgi:hypothetical protein